MKLKDLLIAGIIAFAIAYSTRAIAQKSPIEKVWYDQKKTCKVQIYKGADGKYYGKTIWLSENIDKKTGKPYTDKENPDENQRNKPLIGLVLLQGFEQDPQDKNVFTGGSVYDPDNGKTYCGKIVFKGNSLDMRGYLCSFSVFGRSEEWSLSEE